MTELEATSNIIESQSLETNDRRPGTSARQKAAANELLKEVDEFPPHAEIAHGDLLRDALHNPRANLLPAAVKSGDDHDHAAN